MEDLIQILSSISEEEKNAGILEEDRILKKKSELDWVKFSSLKEEYPKTLLREYRHFWVADLLFYNEYIHWEITYLFQLKDELLLELISRTNVDLNALLYHLNLRFGTKLSQLNRRNLSARKDLTLELIRQYYELFEFGKGIELKDVFYDRQWKHFSKFKLVSNLCTNPHLVFDWKFVHDFRDEIDFWFFALCGNLNMEIIKGFPSLFDAARPNRNCIYKYSDYGYYDRYYFTSAWENLFLNPNINNDELINVFGDRPIRKIKNLDGFSTEVIDFSETDLRNYLLHIRVKPDNSEWVKLKDLQPNIEEIALLKKYYFQ